MSCTSPSAVVPLLAPLLLGKFYFLTIEFRAMTRLLLDQPPEDARELVREALRRTGRISEIEEGGYQVVGKTGVSFPRVLWSYGEKIYVDFSDPTDEGKVPIDVRAEKTVWTNITANPERIKREFLTELKAIRDRPVEELQREPVDPDRSRSSSSWVLGALGYPVSALVGGFIGVVLSLALTTTILNSLNDSIGIFGILLGAIAGAGAWYHRDTSVVRTTGKYIGVTFVGVLLAGIIQSTLNLFGVIGSLLALAFLIGSPLSLYFYTNSTRF